MNYKICPEWLSQFLYVAENGDIMLIADATINKQPVRVCRPHGRGYLTVRLFNSTMLAHRVAWAVTHKRWPKNLIDHIDGNKKNNKLSNLREATAQQNNRNRRPVKNSSSKFLGVSWDKAQKKWRACIQVDNKTKYCGRYDVEEDAAVAYNKAAIVYFGEFASLNSVGELVGVQ